MQLYEEIFFNYSSILSLLILFSKHLYYFNYYIIFLFFCRDFGSLANLIKSAAGTGLFAMPNAFACVGLFIGIVGTAFMGLLITGSLQILVRIHHMMCIRVRKPILVYDQVVVATLTTDVRKPWLSPRTATFVISIIALFHAGYLSKFHGVKSHSKRIKILIIE